MQLLWQFVNSSALMLFLACFAPSIAFLSLNIGNFTNRQAVNSIIFVTIFGLLTGTLVQIFSSSIDSFFQFGNINASDILACFLCGLFLVLFGERTIFENIKKRSWQIAAVLLIFLAIFVLASFFSKSAVSAILLVYLAFSLYDLKKKYTSIRSPIILDAPPTPSTHAQGYDEINEIVQFKTRPNIWLLFLESIHSFEAASKIYGIDTRKTENFLLKNGFKIYSPFYSTASWTVNSAYAILARYPFYDSFLPKYPVVLRTFKENGYRLQVFDWGAYVFGCWEWLMDYASFALHGAGRTLFRLFLPLFAQSSLLRKAIGIGDPYTSDVHIEEAWQNILSSVKKHGFGNVDKGGLSPIFNIVRFGAKHTENSTTWEDNKKSWAEEYKPCYMRSMEQLEEMVSLIVKRDPEAIIIAVGDHGAKKLGFQWVSSSANLNQALKENNMTCQMICEDYFDVLCAIRWGDSSTSYDIKSPLNLFGFIFRQLGASDTPLYNFNPEYSVVNDHLRGPWWIFGKDAQNLNAAIPLSSDNLMPILRQSFLIDPWNPKLKTLFMPGKEENTVPDPLDNLMANLKKISPEQDMETLAKSRINARKESAESLLDLSWHYAAMGLLSKAEETCLHLLQLFPENTQGLWLICLLRISRNSGIEAAVSALRLLDILCDSKSSKYARPDLSDACRILLLSMVKAKKWEELKKFRIDVALPHNADSGIWSFFCQALSEKKIGNYTSALDVLKQAALSHSENLAALIQIKSQIGLLALSCKWKEPEFKDMRHCFFTNFRKEAEIIESSGKFDSDFYRKTWLEPHGISMQPITHFLYHGVYEGCDPSQNFNSFFYLARYKDVFNAGINPFVHYLTDGQKEGRIPSLNFSR